MALPMACLSLFLAISSDEAIAQAKKPQNDLAKEEELQQTPLTQEQINSRINDTLKVDENKVLGKPIASKLEASPGATKTSNVEPDLAPDLAYGAFQRGYYLTAFNYALPRAKLGDPAAQTLIGELYDKGLGIKRDRQEATQWYKFAADNGSREAQFSYALKLLEGKFVTRDTDGARELLKKSADLGHSVAQFNYAQILIDERPTSRGLEIALGYYAKAAEKGVADAYFAMAQIYARGFGVKGRDEPKARELLLKAAINGVDNAQVELAIWLANGRGGKKDLKGALAWFQIGAYRGNVIAQNRLARMLVLGLGTEVKLAEAAKWYVLARRRGHKDAMLDDFFNSLEPEIRSKALAAANRWPSK